MFEIYRQENQRHKLIVELLFPSRDNGIKYLKKNCGKNQMYFVKMNKF